MFDLLDRSLEEKNFVGQKKDAWQNYYCQRPLFFYLRVSPA